MLNTTNNASSPKSERNIRRERRLWHDEKKHTIALGCNKCMDRDICGGISLDKTVFDCLDYCCGKPQECDAVCRQRPIEFVQRVREISGFEFDNISRNKKLLVDRFPYLIPMIYNGARREKLFSPAAICLELYNFINANSANSRYREFEDLALHYKFSPTIPVILTGTAIDQKLERWWGLGTKRRDIIRYIRDLGIKLVTTPNYSLFTDQPRWDDLHSMKRIALVHEEFLKEGQPAALHVNARTERDWERWTEYIASRNEITHIAFEFGTGAGWSERVNWHQDQLIKLAKSVARPLSIVVRAPRIEFIPNLFVVFDNVIVLETSTFIKTVKRRRAVLGDGSKLKWITSLTSPGEPIDDLLLDNWSTVKKHYNSTVFNNSNIRAFK